MWDLGREVGRRGRGEDRRPKKRKTMKGPGVSIGHPKTKLTAQRRVICPGETKSRQ